MDITWTEDGEVTVTVCARRDLHTSVLLCGAETWDLKLVAGESKTLRGTL